MSNTPRTDEREKIYWETPTSHVDDVWEFARELERENAALREDKARLESYIAKHMHDLEAENTGQAIQIEKLQRENAELREKAQLWEETCYGLSAPHYILDPDLRASKFREALRSYSVVTRKNGFAIGLAQKEAQP